MQIALSALLMWLAPGCFLLIFEFTPLGPAERDRGCPDLIGTGEGVTPERIAQEFPEHPLCEQYCG
jgi:hypothetical protein